MTFFGYQAPLKFKEFKKESWIRPWTWKLDLEINGNHTRKATGFIRDRAKKVRGTFAFLAGLLFIINSVISFSFRPISLFLSLLAVVFGLLASIDISATLNVQAAQARVNNPEPTVLNENDE